MKPPIDKESADKASDLLDLIHKVEKLSEWTSHKGRRVSTTKLEISVATLRSAMSSLAEGE